MYHENEFHLFSQLPPEIRVKIWNLILPDPRIVEIRCGSDSISDNSPAGGSPSSIGSPLSGNAGCLSSAPIPITLSVCRESRAETLRRYTRLFGFAGRPGQVYFDPDRDVLYFGPCQNAGLMGAHAQFRTVLALCEPADLALVRRVAVDEAVLGPLKPAFPLFEHAQRIALAETVYDLLSEHVAFRFPRLEELIFVSDTATRCFMPRFPLEMTFLVELNNKSFLGSVTLALERMSGAAPLWEQPAWEVVSRQFYA